MGNAIFKEMRKSKTPALDKFKKELSKLKGKKRQEFIDASIRVEKSKFTDAQLIGFKKTGEASRKIYTKEECLEDYNKWFILNETVDMSFNGHKRWLNNSSGICKYATKMGWFSEFENNKKVEILNLLKEKFKQSALKFSSKIQWWNGDNSSYKRAYRIYPNDKIASNIFFEECCSHMVNNKPIYQYDINFKLIKKWDYLSEMGRGLNISVNSISSASIYNSNNPKKYKIRFGFIFTYSLIKLKK